MGWAEGDNLKSLKPQWNTPQLLWFGVWLVSFTNAVFIYKDKFGTYFGAGNSACTYRGLGDWVWMILSPNNWLGLFVVALNVAAAVWLMKIAAEKWPQISHYKNVMFAILILAILLIFGTSCR